MKIEGKIRDLERMLSKMGMDGELDPILLIVTEEKIMTRSLDPAHTIMSDVEFTNFDVELEEDDKLLKINTGDLLDILSPCPSKGDFKIEEVGENQLKIIVPNETLTYNMIAIEEEADDMKDPLFKKEGDVFVFQGKEMSTGIKVKPKEWNAIKSRLDRVSSISNVKFKCKNGQVFASIGELGSDKYNARRYQLDVEEFIQDEESATKIGIGIEGLAKILTQKVEIYWDDDFPLCIVEEGEDFRACYFIAPQIVA